MKQFELKSADRKSTLKWYMWEPEGEPVAILQIIHGMSEHMGRYDEFAGWLASQGIMVVGDDHLGHGLSADPQDYGYFGEKNGWKYLVDDEEQLRAMLQGMYEDVPYVILGHSMGSFILRAWMATYGTLANVDGVIIMGTTGSNKAVSAGKAVADIVKTFKGSKSRSKLINVMAFGPYAKAFPGEGSINAWLSTDKETVRKYDDDPMTGKPFTVGGYSDLFSLIKFITSDGWYKKIKKTQTILLMAGWDDPVGQFGKGVAETCEKLQDAGCVDVGMLLYEGMRHEILNETGHMKPWEDCRDFILDMAEEHGLPQELRGIPHPQDCDCEECAKPLSGWSADVDNLFSGDENGR